MSCIVKRSMLGSRLEQTYGLSEDDRSSLEELQVSDESVYEQLEMVEEELVDEYVRNQLPETQRQLFELNYLPLPGRREKVIFASDLLTASRPVVTPIVAPPPRPLPQSSTFPAAIRWAGAAVLLLAIGTTSWLLYENSRLRASSAADVEQVAKIQSEDPFCDKDSTSETVAATPAHPALRPM